MTDLDAVHIERLPEGARLVLQTLHTEYLMEARGGLNATISGHADYCPEPIPIVVRGARDGGSASGIIRRGMRFEYWHPTRGIISTSPVRQIRRVPHDETR